MFYILKKEWLVHMEYEGDVKCFIKLKQVLDIHGYKVICTRYLT